jgi:hypothetical protein
VEDIVLWLVLGFVVEWLRFSLGRTLDIDGRLGSGFIFRETVFAKQ